MKKSLLILGIIIIAGGAFLFFTSDSADYNEERFIVPETVSLNLRTTFDEDSAPILELQVFAGGGCDKVSDLEISETRKEGTMFVSIKGYSIKEYKGDCPLAVITEVRAQIEVEEFLQYRGHQIWFNLDDKDSTYGLGQDEYAMYLEPMEVTNVISHEAGINQPQNPQSLAIVFQSDRFAVLSFNGTYRAIDYREQLREFAKAKGLTPVDEVYKGFTQDEQDKLLVLADDSQIPDTIPAIIGEITYDAGEFGTETVDVAIKRTQSPSGYSY